MISSTSTSTFTPMMDANSYSEQLQSIATTYQLFKQGHDLDPSAPALSFFMQAENYTHCETLSYAQLLAQIHQVGNFIDSLGLENNAVVAMLLPNLPEGFAAIFGVETRHVIMPINPLLEPEVISELLSTVQSRVLITLAPFPGVDIWQKAKQVAHKVPSLAHVVTINLADHVLGNKALAAKALQAKQALQENGLASLFLGCAAGLPEHIRHHDWARAIAQQPKDSLRFINDTAKRRHAEDYSSFFCTGGTTGRPKVAMRLHKNEVANVLQVRAILGDDMVGAGKTLLCGLPLFHGNAVMVTGTLPFSVGGHVVLASPQGYRGDGVVSRFWDIIEHYRINFFSGVPTLYSSLLNVPLQGQDISSLQYCLCGAAPMPVEIFKQFEAQTGMTILEAYGLTEANCGSSVNPKDGERKIGSIGIPFPYQPMSVAILDSDGHFQRHAQSGEVGSLIVQGDNVFAGYFIDDQNKDLWVIDTEGERWLNTGDLGYFDEDNFYYLTGRKKELIIRGGHNIDPKWIEEPVYQFDGVAVCAAIGKPDIYAGELPILYVQPKPGVQLDVAALQDYCDKAIGERAARPKEIHIIEQIPLTPVGKVFKPNLKRLANVAAVKSLLDQQDIAADISTPDHAKFGFITRIEVADRSQLAAAKQLIGQLVIATEVV